MNDQSYVSTGTKESLQIRQLAIDLLTRCLIRTRVYCQHRTAKPGAHRAPYTPWRKRMPEPSFWITTAVCLAAVVILVLCAIVA